MSQDKFEYGLYEFEAKQGKSSFNRTLDCKELNGYGVLGWEVVGVITNLGTSVAIVLKRRLS